MRRIALLLGAVAILGALSMVYNLGQGYTVPQAGLIGFIDGLVYTFILFIIQRILGNRLHVFSSQQQWFLRAVFYAIALVMGYIVSAFVKFYPLRESGMNSEVISNFLWDALVRFSENPQQENVLSEFVPPVLQQLAITFFILIFLISIASMLGSWVEIRWQESRFRQARERAELTALRAQMEPHFLFNTLNTITSLVKQDADKAENLLIELSEMLRYLFQNANTDRVALKDELHFTRLFVHLLQARFPQHLNVNWEVDVVDEEKFVPAFMLQPLVENAVRHGWIDQSKPLDIVIRLFRKDDFFCLQVIDNGQGLAPVMQAKHKTT
ncbi:MAG: hypothetical protein DWQ10_11355, partial [Calditrichaeota bacterium]